MKNFSKVLIAVLFVSSFSSIAFSDGMGRELMIYGVRPVGMGGAFTAVADDENALFYNPAGITQLKYPYLHFGMDFDIVDLDFSAIGEGSKPFQLGLGMPNLSFISKPIAQVFSFGFGLFWHNSFIYNNKYQSDSLELFNDKLTIAHIPLAFKLEFTESNSLSIGLNIKYISETKDAAGFNYSSAAYYAVGSQSRTGWGADLGFLYNYIYVPDDFILNLGFQVSNAFGTTLSGTKTEYEEESEKYNIPPMYNSGAALIYFYNGIEDTSRKITLAIDYQDISKVSNTNNFHAGVEFKVRAFAFRAGLNGEYPSFALGIGPFSYSLYKESLYVNGEQKDGWVNRLSLSFAINFGSRKDAKESKAAESAQKNTNTNVRTSVFSDERPINNNNNNNNNDGGGAVINGNNNVININNYKN